LPVVLYASKIWCLTSREEHTLGVCIHVHMYVYTYVCTSVKSQRTTFWNAYTRNWSAYPHYY